MKRLIISIVLGLGLLHYSTAQGNTSNEKAVIAVIETLFEGMIESDSAKVATCFASSPILQTVVSKDVNEVKSGSLKAFLQGIAKSQPGQLDERYEVSEVNMNEHLAYVWTPYTFYYNGNKSHTGNNLFVLIKMGESWKINYLIDTRNFNK